MFQNQKVHTYSFSLQPKRQRKTKKPKKHHLFSSHTKEKNNVQTKRPNNLPLKLKKVNLTKPTHTPLPKASSTYKTNINK